MKERSYPNDPAVKYPHKLRRIFIEGEGGRLQGISSEYVFAASCAQAFKRRKVKANKLKSESINSRAIGKLRSVAKWAQTFGSFELFARAQGGRRYFALNLFLDLGFALAEQASTKQLGVEVSYFAPLSQ